MTEKKYLLSLDEGTTSARAIIFDLGGTPLFVAQREFPQSYPKPGWVEQDPMELYATQSGVMSEVVAKSGISPAEIAAVGITNQRETVVVWDKKTGMPIAPAIGWQCRRTAARCESLTRAGYAEMIRRKTGLPLDAYFSATKLAWILENVPGAKERAKNGELLFGTVDSWLLYKLTGGKVHATDRTNASRTMLYNIESGDWDEELLRLFCVPRCMLPKIQDSASFFGELLLQGERIPICGIAGDQQAALFGQCCFEKGEAKNTYGTGCFLLSITGESPVYSKQGLITTVAASRAGAPVCYALEGSVFTGGSGIQWLRDEMGLIHEAGDSEYFASKVPDNAGVYFVPALTGLGAPYWDMHARGTIVGLSRGTGRCHLIRAALEAIAYQSDDVLKSMERDTGVLIQTLKADGGASANALLMQFQADISAVTVLRPRTGEATARGAAFLAGLSAGIYPDLAALRALQHDDILRYACTMTKERRRQSLDGWHSALQKALTHE